jgi:hypothetical protein
MISILTGRRSLFFSALFTAGVLFGCFDSFRSKSPSEVQGDLVAQEATPQGAVGETGDAGVGRDTATDSVDAVEQEEARMEDLDALAALISSKLQPESVPEEGLSEAPSEPSGSAPAAAADIEALTARDNLRIPAAKCRNRLKKLGISFKIPEFETPLVSSPVLLTSAIDGVRVAPRWAKQKPVNAVMDCHLVLALVDTVKVAKQLGIKEILFYSTYRPLKPPPKSCAKGRAGRNCRKLKKKYERVKRNQTSQHRFARAIDIRFVVTQDDTTLDVLEHFDRRSGADPCSYTPKTDEARLLTDWICAVHRHRIFNVMLTPNANKAHHNHLHFDLTPNAGWYVIR